MKDPILEEIRRFREAEAAKYGFDFDRMYAASKRRERKWGNDVVAILPRRKRSKR